MVVDYLTFVLDEFLEFHKLFFFWEIFIKKFYAFFNFDKKPVCLEIS